MRENRIKHPLCNVIKVQTEVCVRVWGCYIGCWHCLYSNHNGSDVFSTDMSALFEEEGEVYSHCSKLNCLNMIYHSSLLLFPHTGRHKVQLFASLFPSFFCILSWYYNCFSWLHCIEWNPLLVENIVLKQLDAELKFRLWHYSTSKTWLENVLLIFWELDFIEEQ